MSAFAAGSSSVLGSSSGWTPGCFGCFPLPDSAAVGSPDPAASVAGWNSIPEIIASSTDAAVWSAPSTSAAPGPAKAVSYAGL